MVLNNPEGPTHKTTAQIGFNTPSSGQVEGMLD
jgi:hypothetical protein